MIEWLGRDGSQNEPMETLEPIQMERDFSVRRAHTSAGRASSLRATMARSCHARARVCLPVHVDLGGHADHECTRACEGDRAVADLICSRASAPRKEMWALAISRAVVAVEESTP
eukprot:2868871-Pleurochrysis_carterae.AAC.2